MGGYSSKAEIPVIVRGDPVLTLAPALIAGPQQFEEIEAILWPVPRAASRRAGLRG